MADINKKRIHKILKAVVIAFLCVCGFALGCLLLYEPDVSLKEKLYAIYAVVYGDKAYNSYQLTGMWDGWEAGGLLTQSNDSVNMGTYNYADPSNEIDNLFGLNHGILDVLPWKKWDNIKNQPKPEGDSRWELAKIGVPKKYRDFIKAE